jgi:glycosyltransferase involved in cell wall biosynthesis
MKVSVLILTFNEEGNLPNCLDSLGWCDDIAIVDSGSTDGTLAIAAARGVRVLHRPFDDFAGQRNFGLEKAGFHHDWVLHLDADEAATPPFAAAVEGLAPPPDIDGYRVPSKFMMYGTWLRHASMYPVYQVRLGRVSMRFRQLGHGQVEDLPPERVATFDEPYLHFGLSTGIASWLRRHVRYASDEAEELLKARRQSDAPFADFASPDRTSRRRAAKRLAAHLPLMLRPFARFIYVYVLRLGLLDGVPGFVYSSMLTIYEAMISVVAYDLIRRERREK